MLRPILGHLQVVSYSLESEVHLVIKVPHSIGYTKQPEDGLIWAETCSCEIYCTYCA